MAKRIPGTVFEEIRYKTNRIILAMPRKSVENLYNDIELFKTELGESYSSNYKTQKEEYYNILTYP